MITLIIVLFIVIAVAQIRSINNALKSVIYDCYFSKLLVEPGEEFEITIIVTNKSRAFIPFIKIEQLFPSEIIIKGLKHNKTANPKAYIHHVSTLYLMPRSKYIKRMRASFPHRGRYIFPDAYLRVGDFLALGDKAISHKYQHLEIVVYPKSIGIRDIDKAMSGLMGDISVRRFIMEDPIMSVGFREYTGREPMKAISWNQSAKTGKLMIKQYDYIVEAFISVILDVEGNVLEGGSEKKELAFSYTRSLCEHLEFRGMKYDFLTNATTADASSRWSYKPEGFGMPHFSVIMEGLGRASHNHVEGLNTLYEKFVSKKTHDRFVILISIKSKTLVDITNIEKNSGAKIYVISMEEIWANEAGVLSKTAV